MKKSSRFWNTLLGRAALRNVIRRPRRSIQLSSLAFEERIVPTVYSNIAAITIPGTGTAGPASTYPSTISISDQTGKMITDLNVTLSGLTHTNVRDLDVMLVAPDGTNILLMSDNGDTTGAVNVDLTFDDSASGSLGAATVVTGTYTIENFPGGTGDTDAIAGAPVTPPSANLAAFTGVSPNGNWELRIVDDAGGDVGSVAGWSLDMTTRVNVAPVANADAYITAEDTTLTVSGKGVLTNDTDADLDPLTAILVTGPSHGSLTLNTDGSFNYLPDLNYNGPDSFTYKAFDAIKTGNTATVSINVTPVADAPSAINDTDATQVDRVLFRDAERGVLANDLDPDIAPGTQLFFENFENVGPLVPFSPGVAGSDGTDWTSALPAGWNLSTDALPANTAPEFAGWHILDIDSWIANQDQFRSNFTLGGVGKHGQVFVADGDALDDYTPTGIGGGLYTTYLTTAPISLAGVMPNTLQIEFDSSFRPEDPGTQFANVDISYDNGTTWVNLLAMDTDNTPGGVGSIVRTNEHITLTPNNPIADAALVRFGYVQAENDWWWALDNVKVSGDRTTYAGNLTASIVGKPANGTVILNADGSYLYTPNKGFVGPDSFSYRTFDGSVFSPSVATVSIQVTGNSTGPVAVNDTYSTNQGVVLKTNATRGVLGNDTDADPAGNGGLTATVVTGPANGKVAIDTYGAITYTPNPTFFGADTFSYNATDGITTSNTAIVTVNVVATNLTTPVAQPDSYSTNEGTALTVPAAGVLVNDSDADGNALTAVLVTGPTNGSITLSADGSFVYTPKPGYNGADSFTYKAADFSFSSTPVAVSITVNPVDNAPIAVDNSYSTTSGVPLNVMLVNGVLGNDRDDGITVTLLSENFEGQTLKAFQSTGFGSGDGTDWTDILPSGWTRDNSTTPYTLGSSAVEFYGFNLLDVDSWVATNGNQDRVRFTRGGVGAHGTIAVADPSAYSKLTVINPDLYDVFLTTKSVSLTGMQANSLRIEFDSSYNPNVNQVGKVEVSYDGGTTWTSVLTLDTPSMGGPSDGSAWAARTTHPNERFVVNANNPFGATAAQFRYSLTDGGSSKTRGWWAIDNIQVQADQAVGAPTTAVKVSDPTKGVLNLQANGSFLYTPSFGATGVDSFTYKVSDGTNFSNVAKVTINIDNSTPTATNGSHTTTEGSPVSAALSIADIDADALNTAVVRGPRFGTVTLTGNSFLYTPQADFYGTDTFTFKATDGVAESNTATVTISVTGVDNNPIALNDTYTTTQGKTLNVPAAGVLRNDSSGGRARLTLLSENFEGFALQGYQSPTEAGGDGTDWTDSIPDGWTRDNQSTPFGDPIEFFGWHLHDIDSWISTEGDQNRAKFLNGGVGKHGTIAVADGDAYDDGTGINPDLMNSLFTTPDITLDNVVADSLTLEFDSSYRPEAVDQIAITRVSFDSGATWADLLTFTPANSGGTGGLLRVNEHYELNIANPGTGTVMFQFAYTKAGNDFWWALDNIAVKADRMDAQTITPTVVATPANGGLTFNPDGSFDYIPNPTFFGVDTFTYKVNDGVTDSNIATVSINVTPTVNGVTDKYTATEDQGLSITAPGVLTNDTAVSGFPLSAALVANALHGNVVLQPDGSFTYTPAPGYNGPDSFTYKASDGVDTSPVTTVNITVGSVPDLVGNVVVGDGTTQRSMVTSNVITFDSPVTLSPGAFTLTGVNPTGGPISVTVDTTLDVTGKVVTFSFRNGAGLALLGGSLVDGRYTLTIDGSKISDAASGLKADADGDGVPGGSKTATFHRLFGDFDGNAQVTSADFLQFRIRFLSNNAAFDYDGNGLVDSGDFLQFRLHFLSVVP